MALRKVLRCKIHRATVTMADLEYEGSITLPSELLVAADLVPYEAVQIWNVTCGTRLETYAIEGAANSGEICINGAAAHLVHPGDIVIIACFEYIPAESISSHQPRILFVDEHNHLREQRLERPMTSG